MKKKLRPQDADAQVDSLGILQVSTEETNNGLVTRTPETFAELFLGLDEQDGCIPMLAPPKGPNAPNTAT